MREKEYLQSQYSAIFSYTGIIIFLAGGIMLFPLLILRYYPDESTHAISFLVPSGILISCGFGLWRKFRVYTDTTLSVQEGGIIVFLSWIIVVVFSALPFVTILDIPFSRALFESVSGWTTTGLSIVDVTRAEKIVLIWRSITQFFGGAGLAIIMMSAIVGPTGIGISSAEGRSDQLVPQVRQSARLVLIIYAGYAIIGSLAYWFAGMTLFDAINHSFAAVSTGGFSTHPESIGYWNSTLIEAITIPLMILGNLSFVTAWYLLRGQFSVVIRNGEVQVMAVAIPVASFAVFFLTCQAVYPQMEKSIRVAIFETISALTTTGFSTVSYNNWNSFGIILLIGLMLIGGGTCSTAGGLKQSRFYLMLRVFYWYLKRSMMSRNSIVENSIWEGNKKIFIDDRKIQEVFVFAFLYFIIYFFGVMLLCYSGFSVSDSMFEFASAIGTAGLTIGVTSAQMPDIALWGLTFAMFLGRLEFFVVFISIIKIFRDTRKVVM
ncbi:MAG: TrkH family potassium uptake protein [Candidatus Riflebacteria bacterium]|nr:TrkH family potassium uptake protein [Candidatus Riflebacteria bacterium]